MAKRRAKRPLSTPSRFDGEALGLVLFALGIFLAITVLLPPSGTGFMARAATFLSDWTGWGRFLLPVLPLCYGALVFLGRDLRNLHRRALGGAIMALSLLALHAVFELDRTPGEAGQLAHLVMTPLHGALSVLAAVLPILTLSLGAEIVLALPAFTLAKGFVRIVSVAALGLFGLGRDAALARKDGRERIRVRNTLRSELQGHVRDLGGLEALYPESKELASWKRETRDALRGLHTLDEDGLAALGKDLAAWRELARNFTLTAGRDLVAAVAAEAPDVAVSVEETAQDVRKGRTELSRELPATSASAALERVRRVLNMDLMRLAARAAALERDRARAEKALAKPDPSVLARELPRHRARTKDWATFVTSAYEWRERAMTYPGWPDLAERYDRASAALASALAQALSEEPDTTLRDLGLWTARLDAAPATPDAPRETGGTPLFAPPAASPQPQNDPAGVVASGESVDTARGAVPPMFDLDFGFTGDLGEAGESDTPDAQPGGPVSAPPEATPQVYDLPSTALSEPERLVFTPATLPEPTFRSPYPSAQTPPWEDEAQPPAPASVSGDRTFGESDFGDEDGFEEADDPFRPNRAAASVPSPAPVVTTRVRTPLTAAPARPEAARSEAPRAEPVQPNFDAAQQQGAIDIAVPTLAMLDPIPAAAANLAALDLMARTRADLINQTLAHFNLQARVVDFARGPTVTRYEIEPAPGEKISRIASLSNDLARALAVGGVRVEAPVPGKSVIGLEVPNAEREPITFHAAVAHPAFAASRAKLPIILGKSIDGEMMVGDLAKMPHLLVAGSTGSGKSVCVNTLVASLLYRYLPTELRFVMIDPKMVELTPYDGIPHLVRSVVTNPADAAGVLLGAVAHMERRYKMLSQVGAKNLEQFNAKMRQIGEPELPHLVIIIDELADLMITAPKEVESAIMRLAQMARATGMHLVLATQRPSVDILTSLIKVNVPARIAFAVSSSHDSRTILDAVGAERLTGMGDMLFYQPGLVKPMRLQGPYISETESVRITDYLRRQVFEDWFGELYGADFEGGLLSTDGPKAGGKDVDFSDPFLRQAAEICIEEGQGSVSRLQRRLSVGHARAGKLMDMLEAMGVVSKHQGSKPRDVLITRDDLPEYFGR